MEEGTKTKLSRRNTAEQNRKVRERAVWGSKEMKEFRESVQTQFGFDPRTAAGFKPESDDFSWSKFKKKVMKETNSSSGNAQLLRAGVQTAVNNLYPSVGTTYEQWAHVIQSSKNTELYAPLNAMSFLTELGEGERYLESNVIGLDIKLNNKKFGEVFPVSFELIDDDQTGQFAQKVGDMADYAALAWEVYAYGKFISPSGGCTYGNLVVPISETKPSTETTYPWNSAGFTQGGGTNRPSSYGTPTTANIQTGFIALEEQLNLQGLKMMVKPDTIIAGPANRFNLATILNSNFYPAGAQSAGVTGGSLAANVLQGIADLVISRFMFNNSGSSANSSAWAIADSSKPAFIVQIREAAKVVQEDPNSGSGFDRDVYRWKLTIRGNADFIDPRFYYLGSDGSA